MGKLYGCRICLAHVQSRPQRSVIPLCKEEKSEICQ